MFKGDFLCAVHNPAMKWFFNVLIALSAAFLQWHPAGANWTVMFSSVLRKAMRSVDTSLSRMWKVGRSPRLQIFDDCRDGLDLAGLFSVFHGFCKHMIGVVVVSAENVLVSLGG